MEKIYLLFITAGLVALYFLLSYFLPVFFEKPRLAISRSKIAKSIFIILLVSFFSYSLSFGLKDLELGNRILHIIGGGFTAFLLCFLVVKDLNLKINRFQFFMISFLIVMALGVINEIAEFVLQSNFINYVAAESIEDTWYDLTSNLIGALLASLVLFPFLKLEKYESKNS